MNLYVIRSRQATIYVSNGRGFVYSVAEAKVFHSLELANGYRMQKTRFPDAFVVCELSADGRAQPATTSSVQHTANPGLVR
jgi:hypothetical protein